MRFLFIFFIFTKVFSQEYGNILVEKLHPNAYHYPGGLALSSIRHYKAANDPNLQKLDTISIQIDQSSQKIVTSKKSVLFNGISLSRKHLIKIRLHDKIIDSFWFSFKDYDSKNIRLFYSIAYGTWQLKPVNFKLKNTRWECRISDVENAIDYYEFFDSTFTYYSCEIPEKFYGSFTIEADSIFTFVDSSQYMHKFTPSKGKFYFNGYYLIPISFQQSYRDGKWSAPFTDIDPNFKFRKAKKE